jgi:S-(hydroxymethyl)glutathione dehydrogenase / alcohol dehydrogenase
MKAAVCYEYGKPLVIEELEIDPPKQGEVKVRLVATAICHSDVHLIRGEWASDTSRLPVVAGHECAGIVEEIGEGVTLVKPGDHVVMSLLRSCGRCFYCASGAPHLCDGDYALNEESRLRNRRGETVWHGIRTAGFAEQTIVDQSQLVPIAGDIPLDSASLLACGVITGLGAVVNTAQVEPGSSVAVIGAGGVGLNSVQGALLAGANPIIAIDLLDNKLEAARAFGATHTINAGASDDVVAEVRKLTSGRGVDYAFVAVGSTQAVEQALDLIRRGGTVTLVGIPAIQATVQFSPTFGVWNNQRVLGSSMGSTRLSIDVPRLVDLYRNKRLKLDELITKRYPLEEINEAIASMERGEALRNVIVFE